MYECLRQLVHKRWISAYPSRSIFVQNFLSGPVALHIRKLIRFRLVPLEEVSWLKQHLRYLRAFLEMITWRAVLCWSRLQDSSFSFSLNWVMQDIVLEHNVGGFVLRFDDNMVGLWWVPWICDAQLLQTEANNETYQITNPGYVLFNLQRCQNFKKRNLSNNCVLTKVQDTRWVDGIIQKNAWWSVRHSLD